MKKLWQKNNGKLNPTVEAFETKGDLALDQKLIIFDVLGTLAHAQMLKKIGILSKKEFYEAKKGLFEIQKLIQSGKFLLEMGDEDMHTKIENYLTENYGEVGKKIHTGRSRNDQVLTAIRLYSKDMLITIQKNIHTLIKTFKAFGKKYGDIPMPGYTHMQKAMPSTVSLWAESFIESLQDDLTVLQTAHVLNDQSPLGSAAGYGTTLPLDRAYTAKLLGFAKVQKNPLYCQNSRGKIDALIIGALIQILLTLNKFASDVLLFTTSEFDFFEVSDKVTTGSSLMPQKKNLDVAELLRSKVHLILGNYTQVISVSSNLISGYNRDMQDTKKPLIESLEIVLESVGVANILLQNIAPNKDVLRKAMGSELFAVDKAFSLVKKGIPFRDAYREVKNANKN
ncbi:MAG: argininosuccinate lyase [Candidatus Levybacteria bacterium]|nr:argininosuccinate lyase [Candidatus Levybacteria bacterium]